MVTSAVNPCSTRKVAMQVRMQRIIQYVNRVVPAGLAHSLSV